MTFRRSVEDWLLRRFDCPWPGPRPIPADRPEWLLVGREREVQDLLRLVRSSGVVVVSGASGAGKTSLLNAGLLPMLRTAGFRVVTAEPSAVIQPNSSGVEALAREIRRNIGFSLEVGDFDEWLRDFELAFPDKIVVFIDQFEEVLRTNRSAATRLLRAVEGLANRSRIRFVISVRSEFEHQLSGRRGLRLGAFKRSRYVVPELSDMRAIRELILSGNGLYQGAIDLHTAQRLLGCWELERDSDEADVGLLNLQALLFCLWASSHSGSIDAATLESFEATVTERYPEVSLLDAAVSESVRLSMEMALEAVDELLGRSGSNPLLLANATLCMRGAAQFLGNRGYKVVGERRQLAHETLQALTSRRDLAKDLFSTREAGLLESYVDGILAADQDCLSWLWSSRSEFGLADYDDEGVWPWEADPFMETSGPVLGKKPAVAYFEFYRAFLLGTELLSAAGILRSKRVAPHETAVALIHDRFVPGLDLWSSGLTRNPVEASARLLASVGGSIEISDLAGTQRDGTRIVANLRWRHGVVSGEMTNAAFVNCDFSGSRFDDKCVLQGVTFVNCMLDDVLFDGCVIRGAVDQVLSPVEADASIPDPDRYLGDLPSYRVKMDAGSVGSLSWYQASPLAANCLLSLTGGMPAVPTGADLVTIPWIRPTSGGVAILGGRVTGFKTRGCTFDENGALHLRSVAGTSVEFAEQIELRVDLVDSLIRGLAVSCPQDPARGAAGSGQPAVTPSIPGGLDFRVYDSVLVGVWMGAGLHGRMALDNCRVWQMANASSQVLVQVVRSRWNSLVNVPEIVDSTHEYLPTSSLGGTEQELVSLSKRIDYREHPTREELSNISALLVASGNASAKESSAVLPRDNLAR